jgi:REP-associated tyrosine transposase
MGRINARWSRRHLPHFQSDQRTYSVTFSTRYRFILPSDARSIVLHHIVFDHNRVMFLHATVVMPDHVHLVLTPMPDEYGTSLPLGKILAGIKGASSRNANKLLGRRGHLWLHESYDRELRRDDDLRRSSEYICNNPIRAGLVERLDEYPWIWREWIEGRQNGRLRGGPT